MRYLVLSLIKFYQVVISRYTPRVCRFHPTCSQYAMESIRSCGVIRGGWMALKRIARCHPFSEGGYDPVICRPGGKRFD
ncbi:MAG: membrane protein insertion efficiency factor YidD [Armatimonadetes bacterium]|nr:membrane protein insertion efficiency factor YidD [Armatimonadota bacterium]